MLIHQALIQASVAQFDLVQQLLDVDSFDRLCGLKLGLFACFLPVPEPRIASVAFVSLAARVEGD